MSRGLVRFCDRCNKQIYIWDQKLQDTIDREYRGYKNKDICPECDLDIKLAESLARIDVMNNDKPGTALKKMLKMYGIETEEIMS